MLQQYEDNGSPGHGHRVARTVCLAVLWLAGCSGAPSSPPADAGHDALPAGEARCAQVHSMRLDQMPVSGLVIAEAKWRPENFEVVSGRNGETTAVPAHCEIEGYYGEYAGRVGGVYRTAFRLRLPQDWNGRFLFQGGAGSNGVVGNAIGSIGAGSAPALARGYAVLAQDSGHDNSRNNEPEYQGELVFGFDPRARANYGHASLKPSYDVGVALMAQYYGSEPKLRLFSGCSKGGQEGMAFAQRYPDSFDGILAMAPGMSLPRAAIAQAWDTQAFASVLEARGEAVTLENLVKALSPSDVAVVQETVLATCDADDGVVDGIIGAVGPCTSDRVVPALRERQCDAVHAAPCIDTAIVDALVLSMDGVKDGNGGALYASFPWDTGIGAPGWSAWKVGIPGVVLSMNVVLGGGSLAAVFSTPPTALGQDPNAMLAWQLKYDFDKDAERIYAVAQPYDSSPWEDVGMRATDLTEFRERGGKLIIPHGVSDPVFSVYDSINWFVEVDQAEGGDADDFVRVFPVPGMNHCGGGPATSRFDALTALERWTIDNVAPDEIAATAGEDSPWPGRQRPLCPYPHRAVPASGSGGPDGEFVCR